MLIAICTGGEIICLRSLNYRTSFKVVKQIPVEFYAISLETDSCGVLSKTNRIADSCGAIRNSRKTDSCGVLRNKSRDRFLWSFEQRKSCGRFLWSHTQPV